MPNPPNAGAGLLPALGVEGVAGVLPKPLPAPPLALKLKPPAAGVPLPKVAVVLAPKVTMALRVYY